MIIMSYLGFSLVSPSLTSVGRHSSALLALKCAGTTTLLVRLRYHRLMIILPCLDFSLLCLSLTLLLLFSCSRVVIV